MDAEPTYFLVPEGQYSSPQGILTFASLAAEFDNVVMPGGQEYLQQKERFIQRKGGENAYSLGEQFDRAIRDLCSECYIMPDPNDGKIDADTGRKLREFFARGAAVHAVIYDNKSNSVTSERLERFPEKMIRWVESC